MSIADPAAATELSAFALGWGQWFIRLSFAGAILSLVLAAVQAYRGQTPAKVDKPSDILNALKGVLEALAKLPLWVAIYLAGYALLWLAMPG